MQSPPSGVVVVPLQRVSSPERFTRRASRNPLGGFPGGKRRATARRTAATAAFFLPRSRAQTDDAACDLERFDQLWARQRARTHVQRNLRAQAAFPLRPRTGPEPDRLSEGLQSRGQPVPDEEVVKAFEFEPGEYVFMEDEDFEAARAEGYKTIEITDFVPHEQVDPIYFARTYYLGPRRAARRSTPCCCGRWRIPSSPGSRSS